MVENSKPSVKDTLKLEQAGIGLKNVSAGWNCSIPGKHQLEIRDSESLYYVMLKIKI